MSASQARPGRPRSPVVRRSRRPAAAVAAGHRRALLVIDTRRLQNAAWAEFHTARKRLDKAARDLHRHEEIDTPAFESWLHRTFPILVTTRRELHRDVAHKNRKIQAVQAMAFRSGRSVNRLWREQKERELDPNQRPNGRDADPGPGAGEAEEDRPFDLTPAPVRSGTAREIYRRIVRRLHPDHGGVWTPARERLWHEVQQAWGTGDTDWLSRLEVEWESANEVLGPTSPLSRLHRALAEVAAARRDAERKLAAYRRAPQWAFTLKVNRRPLLEARIERELWAEIRSLRVHLKHLDAMTAAWEDDWTRADSRPRPSRRRRPAY